MEIKASYPVRLRQVRNESAHWLKLTRRIYNEVVSLLVPIIEKHWDEINQYKALHPKDSHAKRAYIEQLIHKTKANPTPMYPEYDKNYPKYPACYRRAAITDAIGTVSSYKTRYQQWINTGKHGNPPKLPHVYHNQSPSLYVKGIFKWEPLYSTTVLIKVYTGKDWVWEKYRIAHSDINYIKNHLTKMARSAPTLMQKGTRWELRFLYTQNVNLTETPEHQRRICAVDLGVNTAATCVIMEPDGTVLARRFIKLASEEDQIRHHLGRIRKAQSQGAKCLKAKWGLVNRLNTELSRKTAAHIMDFAVEWSVETIVFEFLELSGRVRGSRGHRLGVWRKREVQSIVMGQAHRWGVRVSRVCAWGTSRLAFDGSGHVRRGQEMSRVGHRSYGWVEFSSGKLYSADLNAAYNIGARFFVRAFSKAIPAKVWSSVSADVPGLKRRSTATLASLWGLHEKLSSIDTGAVTTNAK